LSATAADAEDSAAVGAEGVKVLGTDPATGLEVSLRVGRFGPYVQLGDGEKPKRSSLPKGWEAATIDLDGALKLLGLPRDIGVHPETGKPIIANIGRFGPYLQHGGAYANLPNVEDVFDVGINRAVTIIAEKKAKGPGGRGAAAALKELGDHPTLGGPMKVLDGKYGPYVNHAKTNATLPKGIDPMAVTVEEAVKLLAEREAKSPSKPVRAAKAPAKAATKTTAKSKVNASDDSDPLPKAAAKAKAAPKVKSASKKPAAKTK
jgi:DNA topoisomerase-1